MDQSKAGATASAQPNHIIKSSKHILFLNKEAKKFKIKFSVNESSLLSKTARIKCGTNGTIATYSKCPCVWSRCGTTCRWWPPPARRRRAAAAAGAGSPACGARAAGAAAAAGAPAAGAPAPATRPHCSTPAPAPAPPSPPTSTLSPSMPYCCSRKTCREHAQGRLIEWNIQQCLDK